MIDKKKAMFEKALAEQPRATALIVPDELRKQILEDWYNKGWDDCLKAIQSALEPKPSPYDLKASRFNSPTNAIAGERDKRGVK